MKKTKIVAFALVLVTIVLTFSSCGIKFHFTTDPNEFDWYIDHYYVPSSEIDEQGDPIYTLYSSEVTMCNPFNTAKITDATLEFGEDNSVIFRDINGNTHYGAYELPSYSKISFSNLVLNFDDATSVNTHYFKLKRLEKTNRFIVFTYNDVKYVFGINRTFAEEEIEEKTREMVEWARKINAGYKLTEEEKKLDFFITKTISLIGYRDQYINHTQLAALLPATMSKRETEEYFFQTDDKHYGYAFSELDKFKYILVDKDNNIKLIENPLLGDCLYVRTGRYEYFYFFE
ncbi:MAG: hypothetical protein J6S23_05410 [Clostridia bacterium]|nr:hypothetical protein [Clostridia bacterium]